MNSAQQAFAQRLGFAGLMPFLLLAIAALLNLHGPAAMLLFAQYSAIIVSFLGGVHWGIAMRDSNSNARQLGWSMVPSVVGIVALLLSWFVNITLVLSLLVLMHLFWLNYERRRFEQQASSDHWYIQLRRQLTFTVVALHVILIIISLS